MVKSNQRININISAGAYSHVRPGHTSSLAFSVTGRDLGITSRVELLRKLGRPHLDMGQQQGAL